MCSSATRETFMDLYASGRASAAEIDDFIDHWHNDSIARPDDRVPLEAFLGMTAAEYEAWVHDASALPAILRARRR